MSAVLNWYHVQQMRVLCHVVLLVISGSLPVLTDQTLSDLYLHPLVTQIASVGEFKATNGALLVLHTGSHGGKRMMDCR